MNRKLVSLMLLIISAVVLAGDAGAVGPKLENIQIDLIQWGIRTVTFKVDNPRSDSAQIDVKFMTLYPDHYLSGLNMYKKDTTMFVGPLGVQDMAVTFEIPGSFGRVIPRVFIYWHYLHPYADDSTASDSTTQTFSSVFIAKDEARVLVDRKHSVGPGYCKIDHPLLDFEFPRLMLFLLSRGSSLKAIENLFIVEEGYTGYIYNQLRQDGFFPLASDSLAPGILALAEPELYTIRAKTKLATETFAAWYDREGKAGLDKIMKKAGLDDFTQELPGVRMKILLTLLETNLVDSTVAFDISHFREPDQDQKSQSRARWIVQGGDFFMPRLCLAEFQDKGVFYLSTFSPDPKLPYDVAPIWDMRKAVEKPAVTIPEIKATQLRKIVEKAQKDELVDSLGLALRSIISEARTDVAAMKPYQASYFADYIYQVALGDYFAVHKVPADWLDCVIVRY
ncbi:MAG: hypothetical protein PHR28_00120 [candidate division Zixibacteria bacterium]|nr:hypothetical protein [candidate division Zixibacteria bacterium]